MVISEWLTPDPVLPSVFNPDYSDKDILHQVEGVLDVSDTLIAGEIVYTLIKRGLIDSSTPILDIGCGEGLLVNILAQAGYDIGGIDINRKMKEIWQRNGHLADRCRLADIDSMVSSRAILSESAGVIISSNIFEQAWPAENDYFSPPSPTIDPSASIQQINLALKPGGLYICFDGQEYITEIGRRLDTIGIKKRNDSPSYTLVIFQKE